MKIAPTAAALASALFFALGSRPAHAYEHQWHAGADVGYTFLTNGDVGLHGLGGALQLQYGITDAFNLFGEVATSVHPAGHVVLPSASVGLVYVVDILSVVPWVGATAGGADLLQTSGCSANGGGACSAGKLALGVPFGLDYQLSRSVALGVHGKYQIFLISGSPYNAIGAYAHVEFLWGY